MDSDYRYHCVDAPSARKLADSHLRLGLVNVEDVDAFQAWLRADVRGFHGDKPDAQTLAANVSGLAYRRTTGVWDEGADAGSEPVGTISSWVADLSVPGGRSLDAWAVSSVTVSPTHRRRGIARAFLEAELATASALGLALSILTVTESTIYGRYGFAPAVFATRLVIDPVRAKWIGPNPEGSVRFVSLSEAHELLPTLHDRARRSVPGQIDVWDLRWKQVAALTAEDKDRAKRLRAVRFDDRDGVAQGLAFYRVAGDDEEFVKHRLELGFLLTATDEAYAALWRFVLSVDLVSEIRADLRSVSEPLRWQVADQRGVKETVVDHLWVRILDVPAALTARGYSADGLVGFEVSDPYGYAQGRFLLDVNGGIGSVQQVEGAFPGGASVLAVSVNELSALYLGGVSATVLLAADRIVELTAGAARGADAILHSPVTPWLNVWF